MRDAIRVRWFDRAEARPFLDDLVDLDLQAQQVGDAIAADYAELGRDPRHLGIDRGAGRPFQRGLFRRSRQKRTSGVDSSPVSRVALRPNLGHGP